MVWVMPLARLNLAHDYMAALAGHKKQPYLLLHQFGCEQMQKKIS
jgi:hypothetical protein